MTLKPLAAATGLAALLLATPASAGKAGDILREALYSGEYLDVLGELVPLALEGDQEAQFGVGFVRFVRGVESLAQILYFSGLAAPETGPMGPALALPVPVNPNPTPLDYRGVRGILEGVVFNFDTAGEDLLKAGEGDYVVLIDPLKVRIDVNGDGTAEDAETIERVLSQAFGMTRPEVTLRPVEPPTTDGRSGRGQAGSATPAPAPDPTLAVDATIGFDRADAIWLAGYGEVLAAQADFLLAHDFSMFVNATFHRFFPKSGLPMQQYAEGGMLVLDPETDTAIADAIAGIHTLNWPVVEPDRLKRVLERAHRILALSRRNWDAILAETDDQRELIPNPKQTSIVPDGTVTDEVVAAWMATLDTAEQILDGELLIPHWRFRQGFDLKSYFETAPRTDLVMLLTGYDAIPYLKDGPIATAESFAEANRVFGEDFLGYAFWFN
jgi:hypothetical protein